jgi:hypothetical protein
MKRPWTRLRQLLGLTTHGRTITRRPARTRLQLEGLEERIVPTIVFEPHFGAESLVNNGGPTLTNAPVYLIFWGSYWNTSAGSASETQLVSAINNELNSPIYNRLSQYNAGPAYLWGTQNGGSPVVWNATETGDPTYGFSDSHLQNVVSAAINDHQSSPILSPSVTESEDGGHAPIYFVITPPGVDSYKGQYDYGYHSDFNTTGLYNGGNQDVIYGWSGNGLNPSYNTQDLVTLMVSHEIGEALTDPQAGTADPTIGTGKYGWDVFAGPNYPLYPNETPYGEIGDYEPEFEQANYLSYSYRLNGSLTQALWDQNDRAFTVSDGTSQNFIIIPQYDSHANYVGNELEIFGDQQRVNGYGTNDSVTIYTTNNGGLAVDLDGETVAFDPGQITSLYVAPGSGTNTISVLSTPKGLFTDIDCEGNNDIVSVGSEFGLHGAGLMSGINGTVDVGGRGTYTLNVDDSDDSVGQSVSLSGNASINYGVIDVGGAAPVSFDGGCVGLDVYGGSGGNTFNVHGTGVDTYLNTGTGNDTVNVYATASSLTVHNPGGHDSDLVGLGYTGSINGSVAFNGSGTSALVVDDRDDDTGRTATLTSSTLTGLGNAGTLSYWGGVTSLTLDGGLGSNVFNVNSSAAGTAYTLNGGVYNNTFNVGNGDLDYMAGAVTVNGGDGLTTIIVNDKNAPFTDTYTITNSTISRPYFAGLTYSGFDEAVILDGESGGNVYNVNSTTAAAAYTLNGGAGNDTFNIGDGDLNSLEGAVTVNGGGGSNTVLVNDKNSLYVDPSYTITNSTISRPLFGLTYGGVQKVILDGESGGSSFNDYNVFSTAAGTTYTINGGAGTNKLVGPNTVNTWNLTGTNAGNLNGNVTFTGMGNLTGGTARDVFKFSNGASISGIIDGGGGGDWLDYAAYTSAIAVNLASETASHTGLILNIQNVRAGSGGSTLTGDGQGNILVGGAGVDNIQGGSGRSVLIGGGGADHVKGGSGDDIVIGGTTNYDTNDAALMSILAEWESSNSYVLRIKHLKFGGGLNGTNKLVFGTTVHDDGSANTLTGGAGMDWFFKGAHDIITDRQSGEEVN